MKIMTIIIKENSLRTISLNINYYLINEEKNISPSR